MQIRKREEHYKHTLNSQFILQNFVCMDMMKISRNIFSSKFEISNDRVMGKGIIIQYKILFGNKSDLRS